MSRTTIEIPMKTANVDEALRTVASIVVPAGYRQKILDGETVWCKGDGVVMVLQCFEAVFTGYSMILQAWIRDVYLGEQELEKGLNAAWQKKKMKKILADIQTTILAKRL